MKIKYAIMVFLLGFSFLSAAKQLKQVFPAAGRKVETGLFLMGRRAFSISFGMPETVDNNGIIYCRRRMAPRDWALIAVRLTLKKSAKKQIR